MCRKIYALITLIFLLMVASAQAGIMENLIIDLQQKKIKAYEKIEQFEIYDWTYLVAEESDGNDHLMVMDNSSKKTLVTYKPEQNNQAFKKGHLVYFNNKEYPYLITFWSHGAHGESLKIFAPKESVKPIYDYISSWPMSYEVYKDKLVVEGKGDIPADKTEPLSIKKEWKP